MLGASWDLSSTTSVFLSGDLDVSYQVDPGPEVSTKSNFSTTFAPSDHGYMSRS